MTKVALAKTLLVLALNHGSALLDARTTSLALSRPNLREANPTLRPFAHSWAIYPALQVQPTLLDVLRLKKPHSKFVRLLMVTSIGTETGLALHNYAAYKNWKNH